MPKMMSSASADGNGKVLLPMSHLFLNFITKEEAKQWIDEIDICNNYVKLINHRQISPPLTVNELRLLTSIGSFDDKNFC